jgi:hypothetical protein
MPRPTIRRPEEIVTKFYGINCHTLEVETVSKTRGGALSHTDKHGVLHTHQIASDRSAQEDVYVFFALKDVFEISAHSENSGAAKTRIAELHAKAAEMRAERDAD